ncbi:hypothetical protein EMIT0P253_70014 [Pseudomonas sp. IT-P253]
MSVDINVECQSTFASRLPHLKCISLWEPAREGGDDTQAIFDIRLHSVRLSPESCAL